MTTPRAHHVGITVSDLESVLPFYRDVLGFDVLDRFAVSGPAFADAVDVPDAAGRFAHLEAGDVRLELVEYAPTGAARSNSELNQSGATHVGFSVADLEAFFASLPAEVETLSEPRTTESGTSILFLRDPEENLVEVLER
ncbi:VOC family protein [Natronosalvus caseinilyticus]|uniref:VOC family protein n=1 Tax=Natronosalvus caseinilyticus TaxID=2953747 RepID=UPI0028B06178|nr:VOC family protein [Natronosalvus caseinilyticus]